MPISMPVYKHSWFNWLILLLVTVALAWFFYQKGERPFADVGFVTEKEVSRQAVEKLPEGVEVVEMGKEKIVINKLDGYKLIIVNKNSKVKYDTGNLQIIEPIIEDPNSEGGGRIPQFNITIFNSNQSPENWLQKWIKQQEFSNDYEYSSEMINDRKVFILTIPSFGLEEKMLIAQYSTNKIIQINSMFIEPLGVYQNMQSN